jgi:hypothetical protein
MAIKAPPTAALRSISWQLHYCASTGDNAYLFTTLNELDGNQLLGHLVSAQLDKPKGPTVQIPDLQAVEGANVNVGPDCMPYIRRLPRTGRHACSQNQPFHIWGVPPGAQGAPSSLLRQPGCCPELNLSP